jgi:hypothetical protein
MIYFSPSTCGFYEDGQGVTPPPDAVAITAAEREQALADLRPGHRIVAGEGGRPLVAPATLSADEVLAVVRRRRNALLAACDWTQAADSPLAATDRSAWADYRQALRSLPETITDPASIDWPVAPSKRIRHD